MFDEFGNIGGPAWHQNLFGPGGRLTFFGKGGNNAAMLRESQLGREESRRQFEKTFRFNADQAALQELRSKEQMDATRAMSRITARGSETALDKARAAEDARRSALSRFGFRNTRLV